MPKTPPPSRRGGGSSRRAAPTKVSKPFPWGVALGSAVLALALVGLLVYAALNQGSGVSDLQRNPDQAISGVVVADEELARDHVAGPVDYPSVPPAGGNHNGTPQACAVYTEPIAPEHAVHSLEHGAVWVTYNDDASEEDVKALAEKVEADTHRLMSPVPDQDSPLQLTAWGRSLSVDNADDERVDQFLEAYTNGPQTPERGAACVGSTSTGPLAPAPTDAPTAPASAPASPPAP